MNEINNRIIRTEVLPMPEEAKKKFEEFGKAFGKKKVKEEDSLVRDFATGMISGAIGAPLMALGPLATIAGPSIMSAVGGRIRNVQVLNSDLATKLLTKSKSNKNKPKNPNEPRHSPGRITYVTGIVFAVMGAALCETPIGPILIGIGAGMMGSGISIVGEDIAARPRYPEQSFDRDRGRVRELEHERNLGK